MVFTCPQKSKQITNLLERQTAQSVSVNTYGAEFRLKPGLNVRYVCYRDICDFMNYFNLTCTFEMKLSAMTLGTTIIVWSRNGKPPISDIYIHTCG